MLEKRMLTADVPHFEDEGTQTLMGPNVATVASLFADRARVLMLTALLDGRALPAGELAYAAGVTAQTASSHLAKLVAGEIIVMEIQGRHRYYRLAGAHVAEAMERLAEIPRASPPKLRPLSPWAKELRFARRCYDHLAGQLGVAVTRRLQEEGYLALAAGKMFNVTPGGIEWFSSIGVSLPTPSSRRMAARQCLDWTERRHHLAGPLGMRLLDAFCANDWLRRSKESRVVHLTQKGSFELSQRLGLDARQVRTEY